MSHERIYQHPQGFAAKVVAGFFAGETRPLLAERFGKTVGTISGLLERARVCRDIPAGREAYLFDRIASRLFAERVKSGQSYGDAALALNKTVNAGRAHAVALGLIAPGRQGAAPASIAVEIKTDARQAWAAFVEPPRRVTAEVIAEREQSEHEAGDERLVAALIAEGGFTRFDDGMDWLLDMHGVPVTPVSDKGKAEFLAAMRAKHGDTILTGAAA
jgi:hypothetical protein